MLFSDPIISDSENSISDNNGLLAKIDEDAEKIKIRTSSMKSSPKEESKLNCYSVMTFTLFLLLLASGVTALITT